MTASSLRLSSQPISSPGGTTSASWRLPRLRHLPPSPKESLTTMSVRPASLRPAIRLEPMNPAPPVTNNIAHPPPFLPPFAPAHSHVQRLRAKSVKCPVIALARRAHWTGTKWQATGLSAEMPGAPILIVPYMWIGDFVRCHTVVRLLKQRSPGTSIDMLTTPMVAPLLDYMPGIRKGIIADLPRRRLAPTHHRALAHRLRAENYGQVLVIPRTWKAALAPWLAGIPRRTGFVGEGRFGLINDLS